MANPARIVVIGSYNRDTLLAVGHFPAPGETLRAEDIQTSHGGKGSNQAVQAARLGARVSLTAAVGRDTAGEEALRLWRAEGIETALVHTVDDQPTGSATILVDRAGENLIVVAPGANDCLPAGIEPDREAVIAGAALLLAQLETPAEASIAAFAMARRHDVPTVLNAAPMPEYLPAGLLALVDILVVNEIEAAMLARALGTAGGAAALVEYVGQAVLLTGGGRGATLYRRGHAPLFQPAPPTDVIDTTGAGDALTGAFAARLAKDADWAAALRQGVAAGSFACSARGALPSFGGTAAIAPLAERLAPLLTLAPSAGAPA
ncbi:ribokinase [Sphingomonas oryzagri]